MILPSKRANNVENNPSTFLPHPADNFSYPSNMEIRYSSSVNPSY